jgi:protein-L-isoaspartate O-methyltransferase
VRFATENLARAGVANVTVRQADGSDPNGNLPSYDVIVLSGSVPVVPERLLAKLNAGGRLVAIVGDEPVMHTFRMEQAPERVFHRREHHPVTGALLPGDVVLVLTSGDLGGLIRQLVDEMERRFA